MIIVDKDQKGVLLMQANTESKSAQIAVQSFLQQDGVQTLSQNAINVNGFKAYQATATSVTQNGTLGLFISAIEFDGMVYQFLGYSDQAQFSAYQPYFMEPFQKFNRLTDATILGIQPTKLKLITTMEDKRFADLLVEPLPVGTKPLDWAIMNQVELADMIPKGTVLITKY